MVSHFSMSLQAFGEILILHIDAKNHSFPETQISFNYHLFFLDTRPSLDLSKKTIYNLYKEVTVMLFLIFFALCVILACSFPEYALLFVLLPSIVGIFFFMMTCTWRENLFLIFALPFFAVMLLIL